MLEEQVRDLFLDYLRTLNAEFKSDDNSVEEMQQKCICIAEELASLGFIIGTRNVLTLQKKLLSDDMMQSVITIHYFLALIQRDTNTIFVETTTESKIFGAPFTINLPPTSQQDEAWLNSALNFLTTTGPDNDVSKERN